MNYLLRMWVNDGEWHVLTSRDAYNLAMVDKFMDEMEHELVYFPEYKDWRLEAVEFASPHTATLINERTKDHASKRLFN